ncbi:aromatic ring-hydroxylating dioxygenase subunit alpha [Pigmentiphaga kullae]|uniref:Vanillate O-demethylase monooxygenase subunit n=1 Tax=Pigmentiphaga kullae TaxID=151784 RepID=A0A4Q7NHE1_9BURK|nr:aromatic ring-hydroxylating dioxygenase subunit alpha [Pigmentiphaga kullae]RZS84394.1 vanillate O-demethylase monooxygenase subunit [Pigmentiphaga kullae]
MNNREVYVRNAWYVAALSSEIGRSLSEKWLLDEPLVLYRTEDGKAVALTNRCSHRRFPLSRSRLEGDRIVCAYHGFTFDAGGACVAIPAVEGPVSDRASIRAYPIAERTGWVWVWTGNPALADESLIPDTAWLGDASRVNITGTFEVSARHELMVENLLDLTHLSFVHPTSIGNSYFAKAPITTEIDGMVVKIKRMMEGVDLPPFHARTMGLENPVNRWNETEFIAPAFVKVHVGAASCGAPGVARQNTVFNAITPRTRTTHTYYWGVSFNYPIDHGHALESVTRVLTEDVEAIEAQELMVASDRDGAFEYSAATDAGVMRTRRIREDLIRKEMDGAVAPAAR